jgi:hypothetical protein
MDHHLNSENQGVSQLDFNNEIKNQGVSQLDFNVEVY